MAKYCRTASAGCWRLRVSLALFVGVALVVIYLERLHVCRRVGELSINMTRMTAREDNSVTDIGSTECRVLARNVSTPIRCSSCKRVLLIVIFNTPFPQHVPFLRSLYGEYVTKMVFFADEEDKVMGVWKAQLQKGFFQQRAISKAMRMYPDYDGYLWIGDDVFLNYPAVFSRRDFTKVWMFPHGMPLRSIHTATDEWYHWNEPSGKEAIQAAYPRVPEKYRTISQSNLGCSECMAIGSSDIGYVPRQHVPAFMELSNYFRDVFFETAIPTILKLIVADAKSEVENFQGGHYIWAAKNMTAVNARKVWNDNDAFVHSTKFSEASVALEVVARLERSKILFPIVPNTRVCRGGMPLLRH